MKIKARFLCGKQAILHAAQNRRNQSSPVRVSRRDLTTILLLAWLTLFRPLPASSQAPADDTGRRVVPAADLKNDPYCHIGRITRAERLDGLIGTAVLVGPKHILTAAHVIEATRDIAIEFVLPRGRHSPIDSAELDGGWRYRLIGFDLAICSLDSELGAGGRFAQWGVFDDRLFGSVVHLAAYDGDFVRAGAPPPLVTRSGRVRRMKMHMVVGALPGAAAVGVAPLLGKNKDVLGIPGLAVAAAGALAGHEFDKPGWTAEMRCYNGASGAPIWTEDPRSGRPLVIGVQSAVASLGKGLSSDASRTEAALGDTKGSRITAGAAENMVRDFIRRHP